MSADFWLDLAFALLAFALVLLALPQVRARIVRRFKGQALRPKLSMALQRVLALLAQSIARNDLALEPELNALQLSVNEFHRFEPQESSLFSDERASLALFRSQLARMLPLIKSGHAQTRELEDLILLGQRLVSDLRENTR